MIVAFCVSGYSGREEKNMNNTIKITANEALVLDTDSIRKTGTEGCYSVEGQYCVRENGRWEPDFDVTAFFAGNKPRRDNCICWEQDAPWSAYHNMKNYIEEYMLQGTAA